MADWDDDGADGAVATKIRSVWDDELADSVPDSWDAVVEPKPLPIDPTAVQTKLSLSERIKQKEEQRRQEKEERNKRLEEEAKIAAQKTTELQRQRLAEEAELGLLEDTFGGSKSLSPHRTDGIDDYEPKTKEDFNQFNQLLRDKFRKIEKSPHFPAFIEQLLRDAIAEMDIESVRAINTSTTAMISEKQKLLKGKSKKKNKGKLMVERDRDFGDDADDAALDADEFDDFM